MALVRANRPSSQPSGPGNGETRSATEPATKAIGDLWLELSSLNVPLYGFAWRWDGSNWLSPEFHLDFSVNNLSARFDYFLHCNPAYNYFFKQINANSVTGQVQTSDHHWEFQVIALTRESAVSSIYMAETTGNAEKWTRQIIPIFQRWEVLANDTNLFYLIVQPHNSPGALFAAIQLVYHFARIPS